MDFVVVNDEDPTQEPELVLETDGDTILDAGVLEGDAEIEQSAFFAAIRQRGSDPLDPDKGVMWAECLIGEVSPDMLVTQIKQQVFDVSPSVNVNFRSELDSKGLPTLAFKIEVIR